MRIQARVPAVLLAALAAACGGSGYGDGGNPPPTCTAESATATTAVSLSASAFVPSCIRVAPGATVTFTNRDAIDHTVTTDPGGPEVFDSGVMAPDADFSHTFASTAEAVGLHCSLHRQMTATVLVVP